MEVGDLVRVKSNYYRDWDGQLALVTNIGKHGGIATVKRLSDGKYDWFSLDCLEEAPDEGR